MYSLAAMSRTSMAPLKLSVSDVRPGAASVTASATAGVSGGQPLSSRCVRLGPQRGAQHDRTDSLHQGTWRAHSNNYI